MPSSPAAPPRPPGVSQDTYTRPAMSGPSPAPLLERLGVAYLARLSRGLPPVECPDAVHVLNPAEQESLRGIERGAVARASLAGALSAAVAAGAEALLPVLFGIDPERASLGILVRLWSLVLVVAGLAAAAEVAFVYRDSLRSVHRLCRAAGLDPASGGEVAAALVRAALEMPDPLAPALGVDPARELSRARVIAVSVLYKAKVGLTNFLLKTLLRRVLGRALVRTWLAFVAVPVSATWNALVAHRVMRQARIRAMGPSFAGDAAARRLGPGASAAARRASLRAVGSAIVRTRELHPNLLALLLEVRNRCPDPPGDVDDPAAFLADLPRLEEDERGLALDLLAVAVVADGRIAPAERRLVREARAACSLPPDEDVLRRLLDRFLSGKPALPGETPRA